MIHKKCRLETEDLRAKVNFLTGRCVELEKINEDLQDRLVKAQEGYLRMSHKVSGIEWVPKDTEEKSESKLLIVR